MRIFLAFAFCLALVSCAPHYYNYKFRLDEPKPIGPLKFENDTMSVFFKFSPQTLAFTIENRTNDGIKINWDEVSLSINGVAHRVIHKETGLTKVNDLQPPTTIPPRSTLSDLVVPSNRVTFRTVGRTTYPVYTGTFLNYNTGKISKEIMNQKGQKLVLFMPFRIADKYVAKTFYFTIEDITVTKKKTDWQ